MAAEIKAVGATKALYNPIGYNARKMLMGADWIKINVGVRVNLLRASGATTTAPTVGSRLWFGIGAGTTNPLGAATPEHFIGFRSGNDTWVRPSNDVWLIGWSIASVENGTVTVQDAAAEGTSVCRVEAFTDASGNLGMPMFIAQFERLSSVSMKVTLLVPSNNNSTGYDSEANFVAAVDSETLSTSLTGANNHILTNKTFAYDEATYGDLDSIHTMTNLAGQTSGVVPGSFRWQSVRAKKFS
jgi:hypothetical protein